MDRLVETGRADWRAKRRAKCGDSLGRGSCGRSEVVAGTLQRGGRPQRTAAATSGTGREVVSEKRLDSSERTRFVSVNLDT